MPAVPCTLRDFASTRAGGGVALPAGHDRVKATAVGTTPRTSLQVSVRVTGAAPKMQLPDSGEPVTAPAPTAETDCPKPLNGAPGAVHVVVVVAAAPLPAPGVATVTVIAADPDEPTTVPPVNDTVDAAAGA